METNGNAETTINTDDPRPPTVEERLSQIEEKIQTILDYHAQILETVVPLVEAFGQVKDSPVLKMLLG